MDNLEETDKFLKTQCFKTESGREINSLNRPSTSTEIELIIKKLPANKKPWTGWCHDGILTDRKGRAIICPYHTIPKNWRGSTYIFILQGCHYPLSGY